MKDMTLTQEYLVCAVNEKGKIGSMNIEKVVCLPFFYELNAACGGETGGRHEPQFVPKNGTAVLL